MIQAVRLQDIPQVAALHKKFLPSIISFYSLDFIEKFYQHHLSSPPEKRIFIGFFEEGKLLGFVFGTHELDLLFDDFLKQNRSYFIKETLIALVKNPVYIIHLFSKIVQKNREVQSQSQLVYLVVDRTFAQKGIGKMLLKNFENEVGKSVDYYELEVEKNNPALRFYQKNNFFTVSEINGILEKKYLLGKRLK